jgi:hypothetical protein
MEHVNRHSITVVVFVKRCFVFFFLFINVGCPIATQLWCFFLYGEIELKNVTTQNFNEDLETLEKQVYSRTYLIVN